MKRIFTKRMDADGVVADYDGLWHAYMASWVVQEEIQIIGAQLWCSCCGVPDADGQHIIIGQVSQGGLTEVDPIFIVSSVRIKRELLVAAQDNMDDFGSWPSTNIMFPDGFAIPIREEGIVYIAISVVAPAGETSWQCGCSATIYYTKGK